MNKTYKVRATRAGALQVVSELTSSVAAIGTKTVAAVATTMVAGAAIAAIPAEVPSGEDTQTVTTAIGWSDVANEKHQNFVFSGVTDKGQSALLSASTSGTFAKTMFVIGDASKEYGTGIWISGAEATATNTGTIYVQGKVAEGAAAKSWQLHGMGAANGATAVNQGTIEADNAYGMYVGTGSGNSTIINDTTGVIRVTTQGAGMELGAASGNKAINRGTITVEAPAADKINDYQFTHGVLIQESSDNEFTNYGTIDATNGRSAIEVKKTGTDNNTINLEAGSRVLGLVHVDAAATNTTLNLKGMQGSLLLKVEAGSQNEGDHFTLNVKDGADVTLEDGQKSTIDVANVTNGTLTASLKNPDDNTILELSLEEQGTFNLKEKNSTLIDGVIIAHDATWNLKGGRLAVAGQTWTGNFRVGTNPSKSENKGTGTLNVSAGGYTFADMSVRNTGTVNVAGGELTVNALDISKTGTVTVGTDAQTNAVGGTLRVNGSLTIASAGTSGRLTLNNGTVETVASNVYKAATEGEDPFVLTDAWNKVAFGQYADVDLVLNDVGEYDLAAYQAVQNLLGDNKSKVDLVLNGTFKPAENATIGQMVGNAAANNTISVGETKEGTVTATLTGDVGVGALGVDAGTTTVQFTDNNTLSLAGQNGTVLSQNVETLEVTGTLALGILSTDTATVNAETVKAGTLEVNGDFAAQAVQVTSSLDVAEEAQFVADTITLGTNAGGEIHGYLEADTVAREVSSGASFKVKSLLSESAFDVYGTTSFNKNGVAMTYKSGSYYQLKSGANGEAPVVSAAQTIEAGAVISTVTDTPAQAGKAVGYLDRTAKLVDKGQINLGTPDGAAGKKFSVGQNGVLIINATGNYDGAVIDGDLTIDSDGEIAIENFTKAGTLLIATGTVTNNASTEIKSDNIFLTGNFEQVTQGESQVWAITATAADNVSTDAAFNAAAKRVVNGEGDALAREVLAAIGDTTLEASPFIDSATSKLSDAGVQASSEFMAAPVVSGAYNVAYDAAAEVSRVVMKRNVQGEGMGVWADVFYASNEAKKLYGDQGYSADIYGGVFGFDTTFSTDTDFYGISLYTGKNVGDTSLYVGADLSYLWFDNDIKGTVAGVKADDKVDGEVFTVGLRADWTAYAGAFNVVPHAGVRYTSIDVDAFHGLDNGSVNVVELPVGVKVAGTFEPAAGWKLVPSVDFTVVPQVGDKEVSTLVGDVDVIDNLYNTTVGVEAVYGQYAFGLDAGYGFGTDDRQNATVKANFSYRF